MVMMFVGGVVSELDGIPAEFFVPAQTHRRYPIKARKQISISVNFGHTKILLITKQFEISMPILFV